MKYPWCIPLDITLEITVSIWLPAIFYFKWFNNDFELYMKLIDTFALNAETIFCAFEEFLCSQCQWIGSKNYRV